MKNGMKCMHLVDMKYLKKAIWINFKYIYNYIININTLNSNYLLILKIFRN